MNVRIDRAHAAVSVRLHALAVLRNTMGCHNFASRLTAQNWATPLFFTLKTARATTVSQNLAFLDVRNITRAIDPTLTGHPSMPWVLVAIFLLQFATSTSAIVSFLKVTMLRIISSVSSAVVIVRLIQVYAYVGSVDLGLKDYELGYWFTFPSALLFLCALALQLHADEKSVRWS